MRRRLAAPLLLLALAGWEPFRSPNADVEEGNKQFAAGNYDAALKAYDRAARDPSVDATGLAYDRGTAELGAAQAIKDPQARTRAIDHALESLKLGSTSRDPRIRAQANYNRGNALMDENKLEDAIESYKNALKDQPSLDDARTNLELALKRRQKQQQQQQQQGQGQGQQGQGQGQNQQGQGQNQQGQQGQQQGQQGQQGQGQQGQQQQGQQGQGQGSQQSQNQQGQGQGSQQQNQQGQGQGSQQQNQGSGSGSNDQQSQNQNSQRQHAGRTQPQGPKTPTDGKLDDLEDYSRELQREGARRRASGHAKDPDKDW